MNLSEKLIDSIQRAPKIAALNEHLRNQKKTHIKDAAGGLKPLLLANLYRTFSTQILYLGSDSEALETIKEDVELLLGNEAVAYFPTSSTQRHAFHVADHLSKGQRLSTLEALAHNAPKVIVAHGSLLMTRLPDPNHFLGQRIKITPNEEIDFDAFIAKVVDLGFSREPRAESPGEMSVRGGIVDVFPHPSEYPYRIEFWGNTVSSLRKFDPVTQRSLEKITEIEIYPQETEISESESAPSARLMDFLSADALIVLDEPELIRKQIEQAFIKSEDAELEEDLVKSLWPRLSDKLEPFRQACLVSFGHGLPDVVDLDGRNPESFQGNLKLFKEYLEKLNRDKLAGHPDSPTIYFLCETHHQARRIEDIFTEEDIAASNLTVASLGMHSGVIFPDANLIVFTDHQFYGRTKRLRLPHKSRHGLTPKQFKDLKIGDYVVHVDHGVGVYLGLKKVTVRGHERECLHLEYRGGDSLYVRFERMDRVNKYSARDGMKPPLSKLGSPEWQRLKTRTKKRIKDIANELIALYAKRKAQPGFTHGEDSLWQRELEASFPYEDTPDQLKASLEVKRDMESARPMDRLVCGDVGFGKTEIAVRAAFKAVMSGKQVAMLVPTTLLAYQHFNTFRERMARFPVKIEMLSRFRTAREQKKIVERLKQGDVDIIIGTHRLFSKDVAFKELGLLVVDEEQRFGVRQKEKLKHYKSSVDVLTLTATPIPRTLHLSLMGARDITNINTPPRNRLPIHTELITLDKAYMREVILREMDRGGQVFFVHNRVRSIDRFARMLSDLVPEARVVVAHGQMDEDELEKVMVDFMERKFQILVSTMIIESGLDIPNVNTIIVNRADTFGLAQLYQLRGRVGRSHQRAHAFLIIPPIETLTDDALKRLRAIEEFSEIGSGNLLAMRDLEIRGAGNLLGAEQTGFIDDLGFDLYNKILDEAVKELKSDKPLEEPLDTQVEVDVDAYITDSYMPSSADRVDLYRRLTECQTLEQVQDLRAEIEDRFGKILVETDNMLNFFSLRLLGKKLRLSSLRVEEDKMMAEFSPAHVDFKGEQFKLWLRSMVVNASKPFEFIQNETLAIRMKVEPNHQNKLASVVEFLTSLSRTNIETNTSVSE
jgi:transcription-repair coupling factor (superfamily II helicase)